MMGMDEQISVESDRRALFRGSEGATTTQKNTRSDFLFVDPQLKTRKQLEVSKNMKKSACNCANTSSYIVFNCCYTCKRACVCMCVHVCVYVFAHVSEYASG